MATVFCFSSTGNSLYAARKIAERIGGRVVRINNNSLHDQPVCDDEVIGFVCPVYFWGLPRLVDRFISELRLENKEAYVFAVMTYGGMVRGVNGRIDDLMKAKGARLSYAANLKCVENYILRYKVKDGGEFRERIEKSLSEIISAIENRASGGIQKFTFINRLVHRSCPDEGSDRDFTVAPECSGCMVCQKVCPAANIEMTEGRPVFLHKCEHCLACLHHCPSHAIDWKNKAGGKGRYRHFAVTLNDMMSS